MFCITLRSIKNVPHLFQNSMNPYYNNLFNAGPTIVREKRTHFAMFFVYVDGRGRSEKVYVLDTCEKVYIFGQKKTVTHNPLYTSLTDSSS